jgi:hypothetical protein
VPADAGSPSRLFSIALGPARLHSAFGRRWVIAAYMILFFKGYGLFVPAILVGCFVLVQIAAVAVTGDYGQDLRLLGVALLSSAVICWFLGHWLKRRGSLLRICGNAGRLVQMIACGRSTGSRWSGGDQFSWRLVSYVLSFRLSALPNPNQTVQRTGASRFAQRQTERHRRLAPVADLFVPPGPPAVGGAQVQTAEHPTDLPPRR